MIDASDTDVVRAFLAAFRKLKAGQDVVQHSLMKLDGVWHLFWVCTPELLGINYFINGQLQSGFYSTAARNEYYARAQRQEYRKGA